MVAAENDELPGGKVGGIGDVVRDVPPALARQGWEVAVVTPSHGFLHEGPEARHLTQLTFPFGGRTSTADVYRAAGRRPVPGVTHYVVDHPDFRYVERGRPQIYRNDPSDRPFASDATKFARFCAAVAEAVDGAFFGDLACIHLHDWHAAFYLIPQRYHPKYMARTRIRTVYTIHNLALQGIRPFDGDSSSLSAWWPEVRPAAANLADPRWPNCVNPMAVGIRLADRVHTVSPSYAQEILLPSDPPCSYGGEGLELDLRHAQAHGRLFGILNGCEYPADPPVSRRGLRDLTAELQAQVEGWIAQKEAPAHEIARRRLREIAERSERVDTVLTSVSRIVDQKVLLLTWPGSDGTTGLEGILDAIGDRGVYLFLGTGDPKFEDPLISVAARRPNFVLLNGYSDACANALYASGDIFVMPSSFEPCGISQMVAMRAGQPCLVHGVGGLSDTVRDGVDGFVFNGRTVGAQVDGLKDACRRAVDLKRNQHQAWTTLCREAAGKRFFWDATIQAYLTYLYQ